MKKMLLLILIGLLLVLSLYIVLNGFSVGKVEILSYTGMQQKNKQLDEKIKQASKLAEKDYKQKTAEVQENTQKLKQTKKEYEDMTIITPEGDVQLTKQIERYEVETLWVKLGNYATSEGVVLRIDIVKSSGAQNNYNLKFTVNGSYISITDFISDIENDSTLGFKIEEFKMLPVDSGTKLQATFVCKDIGIKDVSETSNPNVGLGGNTNTTNAVEREEQEEEEGEDTEETTDTGKTTNSTNTTNAKNTTSNAANVTQKR